MSKEFDSFFDVLPASQKQLWPALNSIPELGFMLYGDTAIANVEHACQVIQNAHWKCV